MGGGGQGHCRSDFLLSWLVVPGGPLQYQLLQRVWRQQSVHLSLSLFYFYLLAVLGLCCCTGAFFSCGEHGLFFAAVCRLLVMVALLEQIGLCSSGTAVVHRLSCSEPRGIFPERDPTGTPCTARWVLNHWTTGGGSPHLFLFHNILVLAYIFRSFCLFKR